MRALWSMFSTFFLASLLFSSHLFSLQPNGGLVANAPHLPVHLGSMQEAVKWQINFLGANWRDGDVVMSNHPAAGGSHLPDITVITPVQFDPNCTTPFQQQGLNSLQ